MEHQEEEFALDSRILKALFLIEYTNCLTAGAIR